MSTLKKTLTVAVMAPLLTVAACGSDDTPPDASRPSPGAGVSPSSTSPSNTPSSSTSETTTSDQDLKDATLGLKFHSRAGQPSWVVNNVGTTVVTTPTHTVAYQPTTMTLAGRHSSDGKTAWSDDVTAPPGRITLAQGAQVNVFPVYPNVAVVWQGHSTHDELHDGIPITVVAVYDSATGKQVGKTFTYRGADVDDEMRVDAASRYVLHLTGHDDEQTFLFPDASVTTGARGVDGNKNPTGDAYQATDATIEVPLTRDVSLAVSGSKGTNQEADVQFMRGGKRVGVKTSCQGDLLKNPGMTKISANGEWIGAQATLVNIKTQQIRCLQPVSDQPVKIEAITNTGDVYASTTGTVFYVPAGSAHGQDVEKDGGDGKVTAPTTPLDGSNSLYVSENRLVGLSTPH